MFAAASTVYARNPEQYGKSNVQQLVPGHVNQIRKAGVRGTQTIIGAKPGTLDEEDKEADKNFSRCLPGRRRLIVS